MAESERRSKFNGSECSQINEGCRVCASHLSDRAKILVCTMLLMFSSESLKSDGGGAFKCARASMRHSVVVDDGRRAPAKLSSPLTSTLQGSPTLTYLTSQATKQHNPSTPRQSRLVATMVTFTLTPPTPRSPTALREVVGPADIIFECGGQKFKAHQHVVCPQSQKLQDACDAAAKVSA